MTSAPTLEKAQLNPPGPGKGPIKLIRKTEKQNQFFKSIFDSAFSKQAAPEHSPSSSSSLFCSTELNSPNSLTQSSPNRPMAFAHYPTSIRLQASKYPKTSILKPPPPSPSFSSLPLPLKPRSLSLFSRPRIPGHKGNYTSPPSAQAEPQGPQVSSAADAFTNFKHLLLPITDGNPYLSEGTRQVIFAFNFYPGKFRGCLCGGIPVKSLIFYFYRL